MHENIQTNNAGEGVFMALSAVSGGQTASPTSMAVEYDLIVIGAGINGIAIARDAAARGLKVALIEREDIGSGTSNASGRLIHGGLRYLEQADLGLVRESLREREKLFRQAPHLVKPIAMLMPFYKHNRLPAWKIRLGMTAYDILSFDKSTFNHFTLSRENTLKRFPTLDPEGLTGSVIFNDGQVVWSERLCVEVALGAVEAGVKIYTHAPVDGFVLDGNRVCGVRYENKLTGERGELRGKIVVNAGGPWVDAVLSGDSSVHRRHIGGTKGSHLVVEAFPGAPKDTIYYQSYSDSRLIWVVSWGKYYLLGTTDRRFEGDPKDVRCDLSEANYLIESTNRLIPGANLSLDDVVYAFSGVRPLPYVPEQAEWNVPRSHVIHDHAFDKGQSRPGLLSIIGGKLTTHRSLADEAVTEVYRQLGRLAPDCETDRKPFPGARMQDWEALRNTLAKTVGLTAASTERLITLYGSRATDVVAVAKADENLLAPLSNATDAIGAEIVFSYDNEFARTLTDVLIRRTMVGYLDHKSPAMAEKASEILAQHLGWTKAKRERELSDFRKHAQRYAVEAEPAKARAVALLINSSPKKTSRKAKRS